MKFPNVKEIVSDKNWKYLVKNSLPVNITDIFSFSEAMHIIDDLIHASSEEMNEDGFIGDLMRDYSVNLMKILRAKYPDEWKEDWKNEAFLGIICGLVYREEEAFAHIQRAYKQLNDPPQSLILAYIRAGTGPDQFLTKDQIKQLYKSAVDKGVTYEISLAMAALATDQKDFQEQSYWKNKASETEKKGIHTPFIIPNIIKNKLTKKKKINDEE